MLHFLFTYLISEPISKTLPLIIKNFQNFSPLPWRFAWHSLREIHLHEERVTFILLDAKIFFGDGIGRMIVDVH